MRILLITHYYPPEFGAPQRRWGMLTRSFVEAGHQVTVMAPPPHYPAGTPTPSEMRRFHPGSVHRGSGGETVVRTGFLPHCGDILSRSADHTVGAVSALCRAVSRFHRREHRPDVIVATAPAIESLLAGRLLSALWRAPLVVEMRDAWPDLVTHVSPVAAAADSAKRARGVRRAVAQAAVSAVKHQAHSTVSAWQRGADRVVTTTARFAEVLRERGIAEPVVVRNGTDLSAVRLRIPHREEHHEPLRVLYLGNMGRSQGMHVAVEAAARLERNGVPVQLRMVGHGVEVPKLTALVERLGAPVEILPRVPHGQVGEHYDWADTVIVSLRNWEPFSWTVPSKLYELLATGRHISGVVAGESADVIRETEAGDVVPPGDAVALATLWRDLAQDRCRLDVGDTGRRWAAQHVNDPILAARYLRILENVVVDSHVARARRRAG